MFTAMVLACAIGNMSPATCIEATDERSPYGTHDECYARVQEMVAALAYTMPVPMQYSFKCNTSEGTAT